MKSRSYPGKDGGHLRSMLCVLGICVAALCCLYMLKSSGEESISQGPPEQSAEAGEPAGSPASQPLALFLLSQNSSLASVSEVSFSSSNTSKKALLGSAVSITANIAGIDSLGKEKTESYPAQSIGASASVKSPAKGKAVFVKEGETAVVATFYGYSAEFRYEVVSLSPEEQKEALLLNEYTPPLSEDFAPAERKGVNDHELEASAAESFNAMAKAALEDGVSFYLASGYRRYALQQRLYERAVETYGEDQKDSAKAGYSEHQSGYAADISTYELKGLLLESFEETPAFRWLSEHAHEYGYILRYEKGQESLTGYIYEPWHFRYIGKELAAAYRDGGWHSLEEFLSEPVPSL